MKNYQKNMHVAMESLVNSGWTGTVEAVVREDCYIAAVKNERRQPVVLIDFLRKRCQNDRQHHLTANAIYKEFQWHFGRVG